MAEPSQLVTADDFQQSWIRTNLNYGGLQPDESISILDNIKHLITEQELRFDMLGLSDNSNWSIVFDRVETGGSPGNPRHSFTFGFRLQF